jgi:eukaryotic-like serine/threonine-protein kinase
MGSVPTTAESAEHSEPDADATLDLGNAGGSLGEAPTTVSGPADLGRYRIGARLGRGGLAVVYRAWDPELGRDVAIKLLRVPADASDDPKLTARLVLEARLMAQVTHPNVVAVFDVGCYDGGRGWPLHGEAPTNGIFFAMELVEGSDLRRWLAHATRSWREVVGVFVEAGRGLAAAHAHGLTHRDFKPANVLVGDDGRTRVVDFGLASSSGGSTSEVRPAHARTGPQSVTGSASQGSTLTAPGMIMGTPAYMAPEQHRGEPVGPAADQYAFCLALWEGLYGTRPYTVGGQALFLAKMAAKLPEKAPNPDVPRALHACLLRGLAPDPHDRHPDMHAVLRTLEAAVAAPRRRGTKLLGAIGGAAALGLLATAYPSDDAVPCDDPAAPLASVWDVERRGSIERAVLGVDVPYAAETWDKVAPALDEVADTWARSYAEVCAAQVEGAEPTVVDLRMRCLRRSLRQTAAIVDLLAAPDPGVLQSAVAQVGAVSSPRSCVDPDVADLARRWPSAPDTADAVEVQQGRLLEVVALQHAGRYADALDQARGIDEEAERLGWKPLEAEVRLRMGTLAHERGEYEAAESWLEDAFHTARAAERDDLAADAATHMMVVLCDGTTRYDDALAWSRHAEAILEREDADPFARARWLSSLAVIDYKRADYDAAIEAARRAHQIYTSRLPEDDLRLATTAGNLAGMLGAAGRGQEGASLHELTLKVRQAALGPSHPDVAQALNTWGVTLSSLGRQDEALPILARAVGGWEASLGAEHPLVAMALNNLATAELDLGKLEAGRDHHARALAIREATVGPDHADTGVSHMGLGTAYGHLGDYARADAHFRSSLLILRQSLGDAHPYVGLVRINLGSIAFTQERLEDARTEFEAAVASMAAVPNHPFMAHARGGFGLTLLEIGEPQAAIEHLQYAIDTGVPAQNELAKFHFALAQSLWDTRHDRIRARTEAERALALLAEAPASDTKTSLDPDEVRRWLAAHS